MSSESSTSARLDNILAHLQPSPARLLDDNVIIITGAAQGIGRATAEIFAQHGAALVLADLDGKLADELSQALKLKFGTESLVVAGNVLDEDYPNKVVAAALERFGKINCLANIAGFLMDSPIWKMTDQQFDMIQKAHLYAPFRFIRGLSSHWARKDLRDMPKSVINISSTSGLHGGIGHINYATAKAGIVGMTKTVASEWAKYNVRCNVVAPGWIDTRISRPPETQESWRMGDVVVRPGVPLNSSGFRDKSTIPLGRPGTAHEVANCFLFLASPLSSYVTGTTIECTGGRYM